jgi:hypothetical protein
MAFVPVPVLLDIRVVAVSNHKNPYRSGRNSPLSIISLIKSRYWYSSWRFGVAGLVVATGSSWLATISLCSTGSVMFA